MKFNKYLFFAALAIFMSLASLAVDVLIQYVGLASAISDNMMLIIRVAVCCIVNAAIALSPLFRHLTGGKRWIWTLCAIPTLFIFSAFSTSMNLSGSIDAQAKEIAAARESKQARLDLARSITATADKKTHIIHVTSAGRSQELAAQQLDASDRYNKTASQVTSDEQAEIPVNAINALLGLFTDYKISSKDYLMMFMMSMSFGLLLIGYFFGELGLKMIELASDALQHKDRRLQTTSDRSQTAYRQKRRRLFALPRFFKKSSQTSIDFDTALKIASKKLDHKTVSMRKVRQVVKRPIDNNIAAAVSKHIKSTAA